MTRLLRLFMLSIGALLLACAPALALEPSEIALVVNKRVPASRKLAEFYAAERHIPDGRIIDLDIDPITVLYPAEEIPFNRYDAQIAAPIRTFLTAHGLRSQVKCLVTFYGVPFRIARRVLTPAEQSEVAILPKELQESSEAADAQVGVVEQIAKSYDPAFAISGGKQPQQLALRLNAAMKACLRSLPGELDSKVRADNSSKIIAALNALNGPLESTVILSQSALASLQEKPATPAQVQMARQQLEIKSRQLIAMRSSAVTPDDRGKIRQLAQESFGLLNKVALTQSQLDGLNPTESESAVDSELAALWWIEYPHTRWVSNTLHWRIGTINSPVGGPTLMVTRLDGPTEMSVTNLMQHAYEAEQKGLSGIAVIDARGKPANDPYGQYDQLLRNLADLLRNKSKMPVVLDNEEPVIAYHSIHQPIALYVGWYSLRDYRPPGAFVSGAVGMHVASFEMITLRGKNEKGWVRGLILDGVGATVGPVAEPYLQSFPAADEFFPLLLTGKVTLAEAYWRTTPMISWMQCCIGDPLYNPFLHNPQLSMSDLPERITHAPK